MCVLRCLMFVVVCCLLFMCRFVVASLWLGAWCLALGALCLVLVVCCLLFVVCGVLCVVSWLVVVDRC